MAFLVGNQKFQSAPHFCIGLGDHYVLQTHVFSATLQVGVSWFQTEFYVIISKYDRRTST